MVCAKEPIVYYGYSLPTRADLAGPQSTLGTLGDTLGSTQIRYHPLAQGPLTSPYLRVPSAAGSTQNDTRRKIGLWMGDNVQEWQIVRSRTQS